MITYAAVAATDLVNAVSALYVATRNALTVPPNLNADLLDYYVFTGLQAGIATAGTPSYTRAFDLRSMRRIRGEERTMFFRVTNNEVTPMAVGMELRALLQKS